MGADLTAAFVIEGEEELIQALQRLWPAFRDAGEMGAADWADDVMFWSKRLCPVDTGALRASGYTETSSTENTIDVELGYTQNYAVYVHENMEAHHEVGQAKFLETPMLIKSQELMKRIVQEMERAAESVA